MEKFNLAPNEGIILRYDEVLHNGKGSEIVLTNLNLICIEANKAIFKTTYNVLKYPIGQIKVVGGKPQVAVVKNKDGLFLNVLLVTGMEKFEFPCDLFEGIVKKKKADEWVEQINILLTGNHSANNTDNSFMNNVKKTLGSVGINIKTKEDESTRNITTKCIGCRAPLSGKQGQTVRCKYCDTEQTL